MNLILFSGLLETIHHKHTKNHDSTKNLISQLHSDISLIKVNKNFLLKYLLITSNGFITIKITY